MFDDFFLEIFKRNCIDIFMNLIVKSFPTKGIGSGECCRGKLVKRKKSDKDCVTHPNNYIFLITTRFDRQIRVFYFPDVVVDSQIQLTRLVITNG